MPIRVEYWADKNIIYVRHNGNSTFEDRLQAKAEIMAISCPDRRILSDVRELSESMSNKECEELGKAVGFSPSLFRKVAVLYREGFHPYVIPLSNAVLIGADINDFTSMEEAVNWLRS